MNRKRNLESLQKDALKRGKEFERKVIVQLESTILNSLGKRKTFKRCVEGAQTKSTF